MSNPEHIGKVIPRVMKAFKLKPDKVQEPKEWEEQQKLFLWAHGRPAHDQVVRTKQGLKIVHIEAIPAVCQDPRILLLNGSMNGLRSTPQAVAMAKLCGLRPGYPDTFLPVPQWGKYDRLIAHGFYIEIKRKHKNYISWSWDCCASDGQRWWRDHLREQHYRVELAHGADEAIALFESYLGDTR